MAPAPINLLPRLETIQPHCHVERLLVAKRPWRAGMLQGGPVYRVPASTEKPHPLNSPAPLATVLKNFVSIAVWGAFLDLHRLFADHTVQEIDQGAFIVVQ